MTTSSTSSTFWPGREPEAAAQLERAGRPLDEDRLDAERAAHFVADDDAAHRRRDDDVDLGAQIARGMRGGQRRGEPRGARRIHQHPRALQVARAVQARGEDEMALEQRAGGAEFGQNFLFGHRLPPGRNGRRRIGKRGPGHQAFQPPQIGARNRLEGPRSPAYKAGAERPRGAESSRLRAAHRGLDEDSFQACRHRRRLRPGARRVRPGAAPPPMPPRPPRLPPHRPRARGRASPPPPATRPPPRRRRRQCRDARGAAAHRADAGHRPARRPLGLQDQVTPIGAGGRLVPRHDPDAADHVISLFVLLLLAWVMFRYRRSANPTPSRNTHNTTARGGLDAGAGADPGGDRGALDPAARPPI